MQLKILLDFDGVLFNSAFEAFSVCNGVTRGQPGFRQDISFEEFLEFRAFVTDAWHYHRLYSVQHRVRHPAEVVDVRPTEEDWAFSKRFFGQRAHTMSVDPDWPKLMAPYDFFFLVKPWLLAHRANFAILSTRNLDSIRETLAYFGVTGIPIFGQEEIRKHGSKLGVATAQEWLQDGKYLVVYIDDMNAHLEPFDGKVHLPLHAAWGYDTSGADSLSTPQVLNIIGSLLKLCGSVGDPAQIQ